MALDKNSIDTTTFDILQPAIDYYIKHGTPDEQLRTYYYQGRIYQNQGDDDSAMCSFMNGSDLGENITDSLLLAHTLVAQGTLYFKQYKTDEFIHNNEEAARLYGANQCFAHNLLKNQKKLRIWLDLVVVVRLWFQSPTYHSAYRWLTPSGRDDCGRWWCLQERCGLRRI